MLKNSNRAQVGKITFPKNGEMINSTLANNMKGGEAKKAKYRNRRVKRALLAQKRPLAGL